MIEVNGHAWETDQRRTVRRFRDVLCLTCKNCGKRTQVPMRSKQPESYLEKQAECPKTPKPAELPKVEADSPSMGCMAPHYICPLCPPGHATTSCAHVKA